MHLFSGCAEGWVSGHGLCYKLMTQFATFERAREKCNQMDAHLLTIENQAESDFVSDWLLSVTSRCLTLLPVAKLEFACELAVLRPGPARPVPPRPRPRPSCFTPNGVKSR